MIIETAVCKLSSVENLSENRQEIGKMANFAQSWLEILISLRALIY